MDTWELHFRDKSRRRSARRWRVPLMKAAVLALLFGGIGVAVFMMVMGYPR